MTLDQTNLRDVEMASSMNSAVERERNENSLIRDAAFFWKR